jgi:hypothetical protein
MVTHTKAYTMRLAALKLAGRTIGETSAARLAWIVRFIGDDPATWHPAVGTAHGDCLLALGRGGIPDTLMGGIALPDPLRSKQVEALHGELRTTLRELLNNARVSIPTPEGKSEGFIRCTAAGVKPAVFATIAAHASARTGILQAVKNLIFQAGARLIACPSCGAPFLAVRKQLFCSPRCAQRARNARREEKRRRKTTRRTSTQGGR